MDLSAFLRGFDRAISVWAIPVLFAITLHEVAHGWTAQLFRRPHRARLLGRLSLNPLRHIDPLGTVLVPGHSCWRSAVRCSVGRSRCRWQPARCAIRAARSIMVALAGPAANISDGGAVVRGVGGGRSRSDGNQTLDNWIALMAQAGIVAQRGSGGVQSAADSAARRGPRARGSAAAAVGRAAGENRAGRTVHRAGLVGAGICSAGFSTRRTAPSGS